MPTFAPLQKGKVKTNRLLIMMRSYLKYRPAWAQLAVFLLFAVGFLLIGGMIGSLVVAQVNGVSVTDMAKIASGELSHPNARSVLVGSQIVQFLSLFIIPSVLFAWMADPKPLAFAGFKQPQPRLFYYGAAALLVLLGMYMMGLFSLLNKEIPLPAFLIKKEAAQNAAIEKIAVASTIPQLLVSIFAIGLLAAVGEELFFRGILQRIVIQWVKNPWAGIIVTAAVFSAVHLQFSGFLPRMALGIVLGALYWYSGSLWPGVLFHFLHNTIGVVAAYQNPAILKKASPVNGSELAVYIIGIVGTLAVAYIVVKMRGKSKTDYAQVYPAKEPNPFDRFA
jgi:uncharacterized protein